MNIRQTVLKSCYDYLKIIFFDGLLVILPITLTISLFTFFFKLLKKWLMPIYLLEPEYLQKIPHSEIVLVIVIILIMGAVFRAFFIRPLLHLIESLFLKIPLVNQVFSGIKQLVQAFTVPDKLTFAKVVFIQFPRHGMYSIGFLARELPPTVIAPMGEEKYYAVFIPTTPNPTTGFLVIVPESDFIVTDLTRQEAMSLIISGGIVQPDRFS